VSRHAHRRRRRAWDAGRWVVGVVVLAVMGFSVFQQLGDVRTAKDDTDTAVTAGTTGTADSTGPAEEPSEASSTSPPEHQAVVGGSKLKLLPLVCRPDVVTESITAVSFNIKSRVTDVAAILAASGADIVLLQEVDRHRATSRYLDQAGYIAGQLGMQDAFGANVLRGSNRYGQSAYGTAVLSRYPIVSVDNTHLPNAPGGQQRGLLKVVVDVRGVEVSVYNTHLQNRMEALRVRQMGTVASIMRADPNPIILGGDFNATPRSQPLRIAFSVVDDPWSSGVGVGSQLTHPSTRPRGRIDYLLHRGPGLAPTSTDVLARTPSDHRAVRASYTLTGTVGETCTRERITKRDKKS
jgi:endonuclease/exonuclease/phosphatase family metal-dependent hydrolase